MGQISLYPAASTLTGAELIPVVQSGATKLATVSDFPQMYETTMNVSAGVVTTKTTTLTTEPYSIMILDSSLNDITSSLLLSWTIVSTFYVLNVYSADVLFDIKIKIIY